jgi:hypothetical protein
LFVDFSPKKPGVYKTTYKLYGNVLDTNFASLQGETPGENKVQPLHLLTWIGTTTNGTVNGEAAYETILRFKEFRGGDYLLFNSAQGQSLLPFRVDAGKPFTFNVEFTPDKVTKGGLKTGQNLQGRLPYQDNKFSTQIVFEDASGNELVGDVTGDGKYLETTLKIVADKGVDVNSIAKTSFWLEPKPESIDSGNVESARLRVKFENTVVNPTVLSPIAFPSATWVNEKTSIGMVEIDLVTPPQVDGYLGTKEFQTLLSEKTFTDVTGDYYTVDLNGKVGSPYVVVNVIPDVITVKQVCASTTRLVKLGGTYGVRVVNGGIEVSVGIDAPLSVTSVNELGQQYPIFDGNVNRGTYTFPLTNKGLQWIVVRQGDWLETVGVYVN